MTTCMQLWRDGDGILSCTLYINGANVEVEPRPEDYDKPLGFYDEDFNPIPDPIDGWAAEAAAAG